MSLALTMAPSVRFHLSLNVSDLARSVQFYTILFGKGPAKQRADYAKFETDDPPLVLSLEPNSRAGGGTLNHLGFRLPDSVQLVAMQERLERAGIRSQREEGVECCYARQTKFWVTDPDQTLWEFYTLDDDDLDHRGVGQTQEAMLGSANGVAPSAEWEHRMGEPVPARADFADASLDEVRLRGSLGVVRPEAEERQLLAEAWRVLKPGGRLFVHTLVAERPVPGELNLPGIAAVVKHAPLEGHTIRLVEEAGFQGGRLIKYDARPCFVQHGVPLREQQLEAFKPQREGRSVVVIYKGPFASVSEGSTIFRRGQRVTADAATAELLRRGEAAEQFTILG